MKEYKRLDEKRPMTHLELLSYCSQFYKKSKVVKIIERVVSEFPPIKEEAIYYGRITTFYAKTPMFLFMDHISSDFKQKRKFFEEEEKREELRKINNIKRLILGYRIIRKGEGNGHAS